MIKLGAKELRISEPTPEDLKKIKRNPIYIVLDNVLDTYNVGSIFRLADAVAAEKIFLCGQTETPPNSRIAKAAVGTEKWVTWSYAATAVEALQGLKIKSQKLEIICVEQHSKSIPYTQMNVEFPVALVVGNETEGISESALQIADQIVEIPMFGVNKSLNVMVALGIVLYQVMKSLS